MEFVSPELLSRYAFSRRCCLSTPRMQCRGAHQAVTMPAGAGKKSAQVQDSLGRRVTVLTTDNERLDGRFLGYDRDMNLIMSDTERCKPQRKGGFAREALGFVVLRGPMVASLAVQRTFATARTAVDTLKPVDRTSVAVEGDQVTEIVKAARALRGGATEGLSLN